MNTDKKYIYIYIYIYIDMHIYIHMVAGVSRCSVELGKGWLFSLVTSWQAGLWGKGRAGLG